MIALMLLPDIGTLGWSRARALLSVQPLEPTRSSGVVVKVGGLGSNYNASCMREWLNVLR